jgi:very-short-patch-repair endonuclease
MKLARGQHGVISREQLMRNGVTRTAIQGLVGSQVLLRRARGVYQVAAAPHSFDASLWVAALSTGGVFIGTTAAYLWGMVMEHSGPIMVALPREVKVVVPEGVRVVRSDRLTAAQTRRYGLSVASRTIAAISHLSGQPRTEATAFADRAIQRRWLTVGDLERWLGVRAPGNPMVRQVLRTLEVGAEAESERMLHRLLRQAGMTGWTANHPVRVNGTVRARIDLAFEGQKLAVEADGFAYHSKRVRYQADRTKQNLLTVTGWTVLRFTWEDLNDRPDYVVDTIRSALA